MMNLIRKFTTIEKIATALLSIVIVFCIGQLFWSFYTENSQVIAAEGDIYREGIVGDIRLLNPVYAFANDTDRDITRLLFSGLMKYNPETRTVENDLADHTLSKNKKVYTFTLKENVLWHDSTPITADDIVYTYKDVIQNEEFANTILRESFKDIIVEKVDEKTVTFTLQQPYKFFLSNLTVGLLPKHILESVPVRNLDKSEFNIEPTGSGPYKFNRRSNESDRIDIYLDKNTNYHGEKPLIDQIVISVFPTFDALYNKINELNGIQNVPKEYRDRINNSGQFNIFNYELNQYVAVFMNVNSPVLESEKTRLGLQLSLNKQEIVDTINENVIIDTPLLEFKNDDWQYQFDPIKAAGSFYDSEWKIPGKDEEETEENQECDEDDEDCELTEEEDANENTEENANEENANEENEETEPENNNESEENNQEEDPQYITSPGNGKEHITNTSEFFIEGVPPEDAQSIIVESYRLQKFEPGDTEWAYKVSKQNRNISEGENEYTVYMIDSNRKKVEIDSIKITYISDEDEYNKAIEQQESSNITESDTCEENDEECQTQLVAEVAQQEAAQQEEIQEQKEELKKFEGIIRENADGEQLAFELITTTNPPEYAQIAENLQQQWDKAGAKLIVTVLEPNEFFERLKKRDYDMLLFGQNLGYNLDAYPYWHSSQVGKNNGLNLSEYKSLKSDTLIEEIRATHDEELRQSSLEDLQESMGDDVPAIFLYTPTYTYAVDNKIRNAQAINLAISSDRFNNIETWFIKLTRKFNPDASWLDFFPWVMDQF